MSDDNDTNSDAPADSSNPKSADGNMTLEEMAPSPRAEHTPTGERSASDLEAVFDVPVRISVVLGKSRIPVSQLLQMDVGAVVELDRQVGEAIDIYVNDRLVARGEIVLVENRLGVTMTEIIKAA